jgi:hypothetical protein
LLVKAQKQVLRVMETLLGLPMVMSFLGALEQAEDRKQWDQWTPNIIRSLTSTYSVDVTPVHVPSPYDLEDEDED